MEIVSLHPIEPDIVERYVAALKGDSPDPAWVGWFSESLRVDLERARTGDEMAANRITRGLALALSHASPMYVGRSFGLSFWEAQIDRPIGMLMRPPSRLFMDAGLDSDIARAMPIRLDLQHGMMGGAYIPARLIDQAHDLLEEHMERSVRRLVAAEYDPYALFGQMYQAISAARVGGQGLYEAMDVTGPEGQSLPGTVALVADRKRLDPGLVERISLFATPPKKPGLLQRMFGRSGPASSSNGHSPEGD